MVTPQEHTQRLRAFEVDRLIKLVDLEARKSHDGHWTLLAFTTEYKVAFGTAVEVASSLTHDRATLRHMPGFQTLKEALIHALVSCKSFADYRAEESEDYASGLTDALRQMSA